MNNFKTTFLFTLLVAICITIAFFAGYVVRSMQPASDHLPLVYEAYSLLREHALNPLPTPPAIEYGMIRGMVEAYGDPFTMFVEPPQHELQTNSLEGKYGGIGVQLGTDPQGFHVLHPYPDSPALKAGIQDGDRLLKVDDLEVTPQTPLDTIASAVRGPEGKTVTLLVGRPPDYIPLEFKIKRQEISIPSVAWHIEPSEARLGIIEVNLIADTTPTEIKRAVADLQSRGATAFALDLRNNGGGMLDAGINVARLFLREDVVIEQQYRGEEIKTYRVEKPGALADLPIVILVNENTASAAEIIAGTLQAQQRAKLIGAPTYGKNTIQLLFELSDHSSLHVTTAHWWVPGLDAPRPGKGLQPDLPVPAGSNPDPVIQAAIHILFP